MCVVRQAHKSTVVIFQKKVFAGHCNTRQRKYKKITVMLIGMSTLKSVSGLL